MRFTLLTIPLLFLGASAVNEFSRRDLLPLTSDIVLVYPNQQDVIVNSRACIGFKNVIFGPGVNVKYNITLAHPDGNRELIQFATDTNGEVDCPRQISGLQREAQSQPLNTTGKYEVFWNLEYITSSDSSKAGSSNPCGPGPFSSQTFNMSAAFSVVNGSNTQDVEAFLTTQLPSSPTGLIPRPTSGAFSNDVRGINNWLILGAGLLGCLAMLH